MLEIDAPSGAARASVSPPMPEDSDEGAQVVEGATRFGPSRKLVNWCIATYSYDTISPADPRHLNM